MKHYTVLALLLCVAGCLPISPITFEEPPPDSITVTPVIYIKNEVMLQPALDVAALAKNILAYVAQINSGYQLQTPGIADSNQPNRMAKGP